MNCILNTREQEVLLLGYCAASLDPETARTYARHIIACEHCREMVAMQKLVDESLSNWHAPELGLDFDRKLFARIRAEETSPKSWWRQLIPAQFSDTSWGWKPIFVIALATIALAIFLTRTPGAADLPQQADLIKADEIEQVELALDDMEALHALQQVDSASASKESM